MVLAEKLSNEVKAWGVLAIIIVVMTLILIKFKVANPANMTCGALYTYNASANNCYLTTNSSTTTAIGSIASTADSFISALAEPKNWVVIAIIALIGFAILKYFKGRK